MFPPRGDQIWNERLLWQPIPVHSIPDPIDYYISGEMACARYLKAREEYGKSAEIQAFIDEHKDLFDYVEKHTGTPIRTIHQIKDVYEVLDVEHRLNKTYANTWNHKQNLKKFQVFYFDFFLPEYQHGLVKYSLKAALLNMLHRIGKHLSPEPKS